MNQETLDELNSLSTPVDLADEKKLLRAGLYGDFGSGKTTMACRLVEERGIIVTTDSAWVVVYKEPEVARKLMRQPYKGFAQLRSIVEAHTEGIEPYASLDTLIWDTASTGIYRTLRNLVKAKPLNDQRDRDIESWSHYNLVRAMVQETMDVLTNSKLNIIYLMHVQDATEDDVKKGYTGKRGNIPGATFRVIAQEVQLLGWLYKEKAGAKRVIQLEGSTRETAKSQVATIPEKLYLQDEIPELVRKWKTTPLV